MEGLFRPPGSRLVMDPGDVRLGDLVDRGGCGERGLCVVGIPWDWDTAGRPGARYAPSRIREHLYSLTPFGETRLCDLGDVAIAPGDRVESWRRIVRAVEEASKICRGILVLGGDHSITSAVHPALARALGEPLGLLVFDAHLDLRRLSEGRSSGTYLKDLLENNRDLVSGVAVIGVRAHSNPGYMIGLAERLGIGFFTSEEASEDPEGVSEKALEILSRGRRIYVSFDSDSLDPGQCPGTNSPSPMGLSLREAIKILRMAGERLEVAGSDIVEYVPHLDLGDMCGRSLGLVGYEMLRIMSRRGL